MALVELSAIWIICKALFELHLLGEKYNAESLKTTKYVNLEILLTSFFQSNIRFWICAGKLLAYSVVPLKGCHKHPLLGIDQQLMKILHNRKYSYNNTRNHIQLRFLTSKCVWCFSPSADIPTQVRTSCQVSLNPTHKLSTRETGLIHPCWQYLSGIHSSIH